MPESMRRDVRLLGDLLGEVLRESGGQALLDDVERLRLAVIAARHPVPHRTSHDGGPPEAAPADGAPHDGAPPDGAPHDGAPHEGAPHGDGALGPADPAGDEIAALVAGWPLDRAELVARAFTVYFHLTNLAEEQQRVRALRERDSGAGLVRESLAAAVAEFRQDQGTEHLDDLLARLRVHPVLTAHPTEARRRAVVTALRRISVLLAALDHTRPGAADQSEIRRRLREEIDLLWLTSPLRDKAMEPIDEVRTVMAAFDETLFVVAPTLYRALDEARRGRRGPAARARPPGCVGGPRVPALRQLGRRRPGRQPLRHGPGDQGDRGHPGRSRPPCPGERHHPDRPRAHRARRRRAAQPGFRPGTGSCGDGPPGTAR